MNRHKSTETGVVVSGDGKTIRCDVHGDAPSVALDGGLGCRACASEAYRAHEQIARGATEVQI